MAISTRKLSRKRMSLRSRSHTILAGRFTSNIRELEGALHPGRSLRLDHRRTCETVGIGAPMLDPVGMRSW